MKFVILSHKLIPGFGVMGPVLSPAKYDIHQVLKWVAVGLDVREVMEDGSYRKLTFNDERLMEALNNKLKKQAEKREAVKKELEEINGERIVVRNNVQLAGEVIDRVKEKKKEVVKKVVKKKEEPKPIIEQIEEEPPVELFIDELEKPE